MAAAAPGREVRAVPAAAALRQLSEELGDQAHVLDGVGPGVLPDSVDVMAPGHHAWSRRGRWPARVRALPGVADVDYGNAWLEKLELLVSRARIASVVLFAVLALATAVLVGNTLRLAVFARREEIEIMKLVGATDSLREHPLPDRGAAAGARRGGAGGAGPAGRVRRGWCRGCRRPCRSPRRSGSGTRSPPRCCSGSWPGAPRWASWAAPWRWCGR